MLPENQNDCNRDGIVSSAFQIISVFGSARDQMYQEINNNAEIKMSCKLFFLFFFWGNSNQ